MEIRVATPADDFEAISRIYARSWKAAYKGIVPQDYLDELPETRWAGFLNQRPESTLVLLEDGRYIGTSGFGAARDDARPGWGEVFSIYLLPEYFGKGYGKPLLSGALDALHGQGFKQVYLWVLEENARARAFYEKCGFWPTEDRMTLEIGGKELTEMRYAYP